MKRGQGIPVGPGISGITCFPRRNGDLLPYGGGWNLQFFAEEKTEEATPRKRRKEREEGRVAKSQDLNAAVVVMTGLTSLLLFSGLLWKSFRFLLRWCALRTESIGLERGDWVRPIVHEGVVRFLWAWLPIGGVCFLAAFSVVALQVGLKFSGKALIPKTDRFNVINGIKKMVSLRALVEMIKAILKAVILFVVLVSSVRGELANLAGMADFSAPVGMERVLRTVFRIGLKMGGVLLVLGLADYLYQKWEFERSIKMTKQEIKDEYKQMEGDPMIRSKIRQKQREMSRKRMMNAVPGADVVVTNPTHLAIALRYEKEKTNAPVVVAKGADHLAFKIREIAEIHSVPLVENRPLARGLYPMVEVGDEVPEEFFQAVAEVLVYVYSLKDAHDKANRTREVGTDESVNKGWRF